MDSQHLIDSIVRQTTVLIAQLATTGGVRAQLAELANRVFLDLADELHAQGVSRKVSADMFGLALRTYLRRIQRLRESSTERGRSLWEAIFAHLSGGALVTRASLLERFQSDEPELVNAILQDMSDSGLVLRLGQGAGAAFRAATPQELDSLRGGDPRAISEPLLWVLIYREGPLTLAALERRTRGVPLQAALERLVASGRVQRQVGGAEASYAAREFFVPLGATTGWEAAVFDHYQALVKTVTTKLQAELSSQPSDLVGGSTYSVEVWPGHPLEHEVLGQLAAFRDRMGDLRARVRAFNTVRTRPREYLAVTIYGGQCVTPESDEQEREHV